ncbi:MAG TPA: PQ-loop domain-containing transporter [Jatrophihabitans sp.]|jgi:uncharacterized protein with PQ loop repeat
MSITPHEIGTLFGYFGATLGVSMVIPQILRTLRNRKLTGVSALSWSMSVFSCTGWMLYGILAHEAVQIPGNVLLVSGSIAVVLLAPARISVPLRALLLILGLGSYGLLAAATSADMVVAIAIAIGVAGALPQIARSIRRPKHQRSAVSLSTWWMKVFSQACWLLFAVLVRDWTVLASSLFVQTCNVTVLAVESRRAVVVHHDADALPQIVAATA